MNTHMLFILQDVPTRKVSLYIVYFTCYSTKKVSLTLFILHVILQKW
jgi:hypothetical protein